LKDWYTSKKALTRRRFLQRSVYSATSAALGLLCSCKPEAGGKRAGRKAVVLSEPTDVSIERVNDAGFDGFESGMVTLQQAEKIRKKADASKLRVHSVMRGWAKFNSNDKDEVDKSIEVTIDALKLAHACGADTILLVPGRIGGMSMPQPWEFRVKFDRQSGRLIAVTENDNDKYVDYIAAHNHAYDAFSKAVKRLIPQAEKTRVIIAIENVWNNLFVDPHYAAHFIDSFRSPWVRAYFDIANHVKYSPPQDWISVLGKRIVKCHVKDFRLNSDGRGGKFVNLRDGSVDWPVVMKTLDNVGYKGWMTIEGSKKLSLAERSKRLDLILAGK